MAKGNRGRRKFFYWLTGIIIFILIFLQFPSWTVEWAWMKSLSYPEIFWKIKLTGLALFIGAFLITFLYLFFNIRFLSKHVSSFHINLQGTTLESLSYQYFSPKKIRRYLYIMGGILAFLFTLNFSTKWDQWFRFYHAQSFGESDPIFGLDIGFYIFKLPFIQTLQQNLIFLVFFTSLLLFIFYYAGGKLTGKSFTAKGRPASAPLKHIYTNIGLWLFLLAVGYFLDRYELLFNANGVVYGPNYTDVHILLPVLWILCVGALLLGIWVIYQGIQGHPGKTLKGGITLFIIGFVGQFILPWAVESMLVKPNELKMEKPFLENNISMTRKAYGLDDFHETTYDASETPNFSEVQKNMQTVDNIRLWDTRPILETYRQLQEIRLYYSFPGISVNRYHTNRGYEQMMVSAREMNTQKLPAKAQTWVNQHLQYTHGYGITMSPVAETNEEGNPILLIKDLPPVSALNLKLDQPAIYYGENTRNYKLVNTKIKEFNYPDGKNNVYTHYSGKGGVPIGGFFKKLLFSIYFGDYNLMLTEYIKPDSRIQFWRDIKTRIKKVAPFLELQDKPYLVLDHGKLYWIQDAYTASSHYPYSQPYSFRKNYIRNSVKVIVDAYNGRVKFYITDKTDPILKVYQETFPKMFLDLSEMPGDLEHHIRYPDFLFKAQMQIYNTYHMTNPQTFYNNEDLWERPNSKYAGKTIKMESYYLLSKLPDEKQLQYLLISPLTPHNRDNMVAWMAAESDTPNYGKVHVFELPKSKLFLGPAQIEAKIDQNTEISRQLSLWDQRGSSVIRGNLMIIPIEKSFIYVEPVFLIAQGVNIPQLKRVIVTMGDKVVMEPTLHQAINALFGQHMSLPNIAGSLPVIPGAITDSIPKGHSEEFKNVRDSWKELEKALQHQDWRQFGEKMQVIDSILKRN